MTPEDRAVIDAAIEDHSHGCAPEWCGGSRLDPCRLSNAIETLQRSRQPECSNCAPLAAGASITRVDGTEPHQACASCGSPAYALIGPDWTPATWAAVQAGDTVRLPGREETRAEVESTQPLDWHAAVEHYTGKDGKPRDWVAPHEHGKVHVRLHGRTDLLSFDPTQAVEILMDAHRRAEHLLQLTFHAERVD